MSLDEIYDLVQHILHYRWHAEAAWCGPDPTWWTISMLDCSVIESIDAIPALTALLCNAPIQASARA